MLCLCGRCAPLASSTRHLRFKTSLVFCEVPSPAPAPAFSARGLCIQLTPSPFRAIAVAARLSPQIKNNYLPNEEVRHHRLSFPLTGRNFSYMPFPSFQSILICGIRFLSPCTGRAGRAAPASAGLLFHR